ncbi:sigma-70 family RNA polymerase sigma factor [Isoptericola halotolerans]|uniref:sigma-70 family RNA polymerase sigma factor n=1 Tax=Isoptericola halotolerans TaxID=300560 RepID=UPI00388E2A4C
MTSRPSALKRPDDLDAFLTTRPQLFGIAYRMLGSVVEAEDVLQEAWIRWQGTDRTRVENPAAFLTTVVTRLAINATTSAHARRETTYVGPWLPEPVDTAADPALGAERAEALELAVLVLLERLTPVERAVYVLREAFDYPHRRVAEILGLTEANTRQLARRSRERLGTRDAVAVDASEHRRLLGEFVAAARDGDLARFEQFLAEGVVARTDGGDRVHAARIDLVGPARVASFFDKIWHKYGTGIEAHLVEANGQPVLALRREETLVGLLALEVAAAGIERVFVQLNPDKLARFTP